MTRFRLPRFRLAHPRDIRSQFTPQTVFILTLGLLACFVNTKSGKARISTVIHKVGIFLKLKPAVTSSQGVWLKIRPGEDDVRTLMNVTLQQLNTLSEDQLQLRSECLELFLAQQSKSELAPAARSLDGLLQAILAKKLLYRLNPDAPRFKLSLKDLDY
jgi:hypothetical protein